MTHENSAWILQANPREWDVSRFLADVRRGATSVETTWLTPTLSREIEVGDRAYLWMSGSPDNAGIVALATVTTAAYEGVDDKPEYRMPGFEHKYGPVRKRVRIKLVVCQRFSW